MIENFFQNLNSTGAEYLLISGQATVLYGAATFSEDIDLWVNPTAGNAERFLEVLRSCNARFYKLTPPWELTWLARGHGFHFILPATQGPEVFLDVMGTPPRVPSFGDAVMRAQWMDTDWGKVRVIGIKELVELKKTQRVEDYPVIGRLGSAWLRSAKPSPTDEDYHWALGQMFTLPELDALLEQYPAAAGALPTTAARCLREYMEQWTSGPTEQLQGEVTDYLQARMAGFQAADRRYWRQIIAELKKLRAEGRLMPEGAACEERV